MLQATKAILQNHSIVRFLSLFILSTYLFISAEYTIATAQNVAVFPIKVELTPQKPSATLTLLNQGNAPGTYRIDLIELIQNPEDGSNTLITDDSVKVTNPASPFLRYSPRQILLPPGQPQTVRIFARNTRNLADGEYRSHIRLTLTPESQLETDGEDVDGLQLRLTPVYGFTLPIFYYKGELTQSGILNSAHYNREKNIIHFSITNTGTRHIRGNVIAIQDGKEIGFRRAFAVYTGLENLNTTLTLPKDTVVSNSPITLQVFTEKKEKLLTEMQFSPGP